jgi:hypothetical protein
MTRNTTAWESLSTYKSVSVNRIGAVPEPWEGITSAIVPQALTLAIAEQFGAKRPPRFQYGAMKE